MSESEELWMTRYRIAKFMGWKLYKVRKPDRIVDRPYLWNSPDDNRVPNKQWPEHKELEPYEKLDNIFDFKGVPDYPSDIAAAWLVVEKMSCTTKEFWTFKYFSTGAIAEFDYEGGRDLPVKIGVQVGEAEDMPLAICRAALMAAEAE